MRQRNWFATLTSSELTPLDAHHYTLPATQPVSATSLWGGRSIIVSKSHSITIHSFRHTRLPPIVFHWPRIVLHLPSAGSSNTLFPFLATLISSIDTSWRTVMMRTWLSHSKMTMKQQQCRPLIFLTCTLPKMCFFTLNGRSIRP